MSEIISNKPTPMLITWQPHSSLLPEQKLKIKLVLAARLILWTGFWAEIPAGCHSFRHIKFTNAFELLYKGVTGESYIHGTQKYEATQTIRGLWRYKQAHLVESFLDSVWSRGYSTDAAHELLVFFTEVEDFVSYLPPNEQFDLILATIKCHDYHVTPALRKLQQLKHSTCLPEEI